MKAIYKLVFSAMFLAIGVVLPFLTGQLQPLGNMLLPMHLPVFLCGLICGWQWGAVVGFILPLLRSLLFSMPPLYPTAVSMAAELAVYGLVAGLIYHLLKKQNILSVYIALVPAMLCGRAVWGLMQVLLLGLQSKPFTLSAFWAGAFLNAVPGIVLQLVLIPGIMAVLHYTGLLRFRRQTP